MFLTSFWKPRSRGSHYAPQVFVTPFHIAWNRHLLRLSNKITLNNFLSVLSLNFSHSEDKRLVPYWFLFPRSCFQVSAYFYNSSQAIPHPSFWNSGPFSFVAYFYSLHDVKYLELLQMDINKTICTFSHIILYFLSDPSHLEGSGGMLSTEEGKNASNHTVGHYYTNFRVYSLL